jgi:hypothetical protein
VALRDVLDERRPHRADAARNFDRRGDLIEAVNAAEVDSLCQHAVQLAADEEAGPALVASVRHFVTFDNPVLATYRLEHTLADRVANAARSRPRRSDRSELLASSAPDGVGSGQRRS